MTSQTSAQPSPKERAIELKVEGDLFK